MTKERTILIVKRGTAIKVIDYLIKEAAHESTSLVEKLEAHKKFLAAQIDHMKQY